MLTDKHPMNGLPASAEQLAYDYIRSNIREGRFAAGYRLVAEEIAKAIDASRMPVREAFRRLATEGLIEIRPNRNVTVRRVSVDEMREIFEMRAVLEAQAARAALARIGPRELTELETLLDLMHRQGQDVQQWVTYHRRFHESICRLSRRARLIAVIDSLHSVVEPHMRLWMHHTPNANDTSDHRSVMEALKSGDPAGVEAAMRDHILHTIPALERTMSGTAAPPLVA